MEKWIVSSILLLFLVLSKRTALAREEYKFLSNFLLEESIDEARCDQMQLEISTMDSAMTLENSPRLYGKWLSQDCEVRPGPEFLLRSYSFTKNNSFRLLQHYYEDESCILPRYTVVARGGLILKELSWITPGGIECEYTLTKVTVIPHTTEASEKLSNDIKQRCNNKMYKTWKPHREHIIYNLRHFEKDEKNLEGPRKRRKQRRYMRVKTHRDIDCLSAVGLEFNELMLIRTQSRSTKEGKSKRELLLGDIHSRSEVRFVYKPTAFQVPLLKSDQAQDCINCQLISRGTERAPPHLLSKPQLPPLPHGQWISQRCEVRPFGMFLTRKLSFDTRDSTWIGQYKFYVDPFCVESAFLISASGSYLLGPLPNKEVLMRKRKTGTNLDYRIENASLTLFDPALRDTFNAEKNCGIGPWQVGVSKELAPTYGCSVLKIALPSTDYELIKLEIDSKGTPLLFMGLPDTENEKRSHTNRPTSYQGPLVQCSAFPQQTVFNNHLPPIYYARMAPHSSALKKPYFLSYIFGSFPALFSFYFSSFCKKI